MQKIEKALRKLRKDEQVRAKECIARLIVGDFIGMDIIKLRDSKDLFRVRMGETRIIFRKNENGIGVLDISRRNDNTYRDF